MTIRHFYGLFKTDPISVKIKQWYPATSLAVSTSNTSLGTCKHKPPWVCLQSERGKPEVAKGHEAEEAVELDIQG